MILSLVLRYWQAALVVAALTFGVTEWKLHNSALIEQGKAQERYRVADSVLRAVRPALAQAETLLVHDTVRVATTIASVERVRDTLLLHLTDTLLVKQYVERADTAIKACQDGMSACAVFRQYATQEIGALQQKLNTVVAAQSRSCTNSNVVWTVSTNALQLVAHHFIR